MTNKKFWLGLLVTALVFGTAFIGCDNGTNAGFGDEDDFYFDDEDGGITYTVEADGTPDKDTSSKLIFTFAEPVSGLKVENITIIENISEGRAKKNTRGAAGKNFTGGGTEWTLNITSVTAGKIRVKIDKEGIERGRKTVTVFQDKSTGEDPDEAIKLTNSLWQGGYLADREHELWYKFEAEEGKDYCVQAKTLGAYAQFTVYKEDRTTIIIDAQQLSGPWPISGVSGTVYLKVELIYVIGWGIVKGSFEIRFYDPEDIGPQDIIEIWEANATFDFSVVLKWSLQDEGNIESRGFRVYRSDTKDGTYEQIAEIPTSSLYYYVDTNLEAGKYYWYKVAGYNTKGEGEWSEPKESELVADVDKGIELKVGAAITKGDLKKGMQRDWYKFTAETGKTYKVQAEGRGSDYEAIIQVSAFKSDKTLITDFYSNGYTISGLSGTVYLKVEEQHEGGGWIGTYGIRVYEQ